MRYALALLLAAPVVVAPSSGTPAAASACDQLVGIVSATSGEGTEVLVTLPSAMTGKSVSGKQVTVTQGG